MPLQPYTIRAHNVTRLDTLKRIGDLVLRQKESDDKLCEEMIQAVRDSKKISDEIFNMLENEGVVSNLVMYGQSSFRFEVKLKISEKMGQQLDALMRVWGNNFKWSWRDIHEEEGSVSGKLSFEVV